MSVITIWYSRVRIFDRPSCADVAVSTSKPEISSTAFIVNSTATSSSTSNTRRFGKSNLQGPAAFRSGPHGTQNRRRRYPPHILSYLDCGASFAPAARNLSALIPLATPLLLHPGPAFSAVILSHPFSAVILGAPGSPTSVLCSVGWLAEGSLYFVQPQNSPWNRTQNRPQKHPEHDLSTLDSYIPMTTTPCRIDGSGCYT